MEELGVHISLTFEVGEWSTESFVIKKYVVDANEEMWALCQKLMTVFSYKAFGVLPGKIEVINLIEGTKYEYVPKQEDIKAGIDDLFRMKEMLQQPEHYTERNFRSECMSCAFRSECQMEEVKEGSLQKKNIVH
jgi:CRISPR/Cas system-associated exonuclease Cas4 (RecB family)